MPPRPRLAYQALQKMRYSDFLDPFFNYFEFFLGTSAEGVMSFHSSGKRMHEGLVLRGAARALFLEIPIT